MDPDHTTKVQQLFVQHGASVKYFVLSLLPHPGEADDIVQEVFLTVTAKANDFEEGTNFKAWAFAIARFKVLEHLRKKKREPLAFSEETIELLTNEAGELPVDSAGDDQALSQALTECMKKLSPKTSSLVELVYRNGIKPGAAAAKIGWKPDAAYVGLSRARKQLRACIEKRVGAQSI